MIRSATSDSFSRLPPPPQTTANSSPPIRPTRPPSPTDCCKPPADLDQQLIADRMAQRVVDQLEPIEIDQQQRAAALVFPLPHHRFFQQLANQQSVGESGQRIGSGGAD